MKLKWFLEKWNAFVQRTKDVALRYHKVLWFSMDLVILRVTDIL